MKIYSVVHICHWYYIVYLDSLEVEAWGSNPQMLQLPALTTTHIVCACNALSETEIKSALTDH